jgi:hypothetical protein
MPSCSLCIREYRMKAEFTLRTGNRYFGSSKRYLLQGSCCCRILPFASLHACVRIIADRLVIHNNMEQQMPVHAVLFV